MSIIRKYYLHHLLFWLLLFSGWHYFRYQDYPNNNAIWMSLVKVTDLALMVYITNYLLIPKFLYRKRYWVFGIIFLFMIIASSVFKMYVLGLLMNNPRMFSLAGGLKGRIYDNVLPHILLVSTGAAFKLMLDQVRSQRRMAELAMEKSAAELNFLKSQVNPHFLFNSLNSVYFLIDKENSEAKKTLLQFADLLRYQLYECNAETIEIEKEIAFLNDYIQLQKLRKDNQYEVEVQIGKEVKGFRIPPLFLIPFVENAFKHISHFDEQKNFVTVSLSQMNGSFEFSVSNSREAGQISTEPSGGIGLNNVKRRLELLYPGNYELDIEDLESKFTVELKLKIDKGSGLKTNV